MKIYDVKDFGAIGDGETLNTEAIQSAIDECSRFYRTINYDASGKITGIEILEYNEYSECILSDYRDARGNLIQSMSYEYGTVKPE